MKVPKILKNKYVLYAVLILAVVNVLGYLTMKDYNSLIMFVVVGVLASYFNKNMTINLLLAIVVTSLSRNHVRLFEGFKEGEDEDEENDEGKQKKDEDDEVSSKKCKGKNCKKNNKDGMGQRNVPHSKPASVGNDDDESPGERVDYAATMEQAYDNLNNMLGSDGMKGLTAETKHLVEQQKNLMESLNSMGPMLNSAKDTLKNLDLPNMKDMEKMISNLNGK